MFPWVCRLAALHRRYGDVTKSFQPRYKFEEREHYCSEYRTASTTSSLISCHEQCWDIHDYTFTRHSAPTKSGASKVCIAAGSFPHSQGLSQSDIITCRPASPMTSQKPLVIYPHLPKLVEAVVKSLDPNSTSNRDAVQDTATEILGHVVKTCVLSFPPDCRESTS